MKSTTLFTTTLLCWAISLPAFGQQVMRFSDQLFQSTPTKIHIPLAIVQTINWLEDQGAVHTFSANSIKPTQRYATLYPHDSRVEESRQSFVSFQVFEDFYYDYAQLDRQAVQGRLFLFVRTGGDGSHAGIWLDDEGLQHFVHIGSGSGSIWGGIITSDPLDFLRFLSIGYQEPAFDEVHGLTVEDAWLQANGYENIAQARDDYDESPPIPPLDFQAFLIDTFGVKIPQKASDIVSQPVPDYRNNRGDPFALWHSKISG